MTTTLTLPAEAAEAARNAQSEREYEQRMDATGVLMRTAYAKQDFTAAAHWLHVRAVLRAGHSQEGTCA